MASTEELEEKIEAAEEACDTSTLLDIIRTCTTNGGDDDWTEVAESSLDSFYRLAKSGKATGDEGLAVVFGSLSAWKEEEAIVEVALGCVASLATTWTGGTEGLDLKLLWEMITAFPDESTIQEQACLAIEGLALASNDCQEALKNAVACEEVLKGAEARITNERNKAYPGRAAKALGVPY